MGWWREQVTFNEKMMMYWWCPLRTRPTRFIVCL